MISDTVVASHFQPSSRRHLLPQPGVALHGRAAPGLLGSMIILVVITVFAGGLIYGCLDYLVDGAIKVLVR
jgi:hypothetical protein